MLKGAVLTQQLVAIAQQVAAAPHGEKEAIYLAASETMGISRATLMRKLKHVKIAPPRKQRGDAGRYELNRKEALIISAALMESHRKNNKRLMSIGRVMEMLRSNNLVSAERIDRETGECQPLTDSAISRALRGYNLHPDQLLRPAPAKELQSLYPNHAWQIDASLCVLYYINTSKACECGLQVMRHDEFYKNKPKNLKRIESERVWSYEVTDHYSGAIFVHYVLGAESAENISASFIEAIQQRDNQPFYGVPEILMMDMGSANTSGMFKNLLRRLNVRPLPHAPKNARATGQVEKARDIIERSFESGLKLHPAHNLEELNQMAKVWMRWFNSSKKHSRHGCSRFSKWLEIRPEQLRIAPPPELCRALLTHEPELRKVSQNLTVNFNGREFDVSDIPSIQVGEKLKVTYNPYNLNCACIVDIDHDGNEVLRDIPQVERNDAGFRLDANIIGEEYTRHSNTVADISRKEVEHIATNMLDGASDEDIQAARKRIDKGQELPFGGRIDPYKHMREAKTPAYIPRQGTQLEVKTRIAATAPRVLNHFEAARELVDLGVELNPQRNALIKNLYPQGVPEDDLQSLKERLHTFGQLRVLQGGGA